jgi:hypothetical protein
MSTRVLFILLAALAAVLLLVWVLGSGPSRVAPPSVTTQSQIAPTPTPAPVQRVMLLFAGTDGQLHPELREVPLPAEAHERARVVVASCWRHQPGSPRSCPTRRRSTPRRRCSGLAFIDITAPPAPLEGSNVELMLVYGLVDSVLLNCPELRAVQILLGGAELPLDRPPRPVEAAGAQPAVHRLAMDLGRPPSACSTPASAA